MRPPLARLVVGLIGLAVGMYGLASLTGCWLGKPPWWHRDRSELSIGEEWELVSALGTKSLTPAQRDLVERRSDLVLRRDGREWISGALVAVGFAAVGAGLASARPRRSKALPPVATAPVTPASSSQPPS